jgi:hypothetical protein
MYEHKCPICLENYNRKSVQLKCHHFLNEKCYKKLLRRANKNKTDLRCPICRSIEISMVRKSMEPIPEHLIVFISEPESFILELQNEHLDITQFRQEMSRLKFIIILIGIILGYILINITIKKLYIGK